MAEAETAPTRGQRRGADDCEEGVEVVNDGVTGGVRAVVVGGGMIAVRRCC